MMNITILLVKGYLGALDVYIIAGNPVLEKFCTKIKGWKQSTCATEKDQDQSFVKLDLHFKNSEILFTKWELRMKWVVFRPYPLLRKFLFYPIEQNREIWARLLVKIFNWFMHSFHKNKYPGVSHRGLVNAKYCLLLWIRYNLNFEHLIS